MSALPAEITELPASAPVVVRAPVVAGTQLRAENRAALALARRSRRRWSIFGLAILACSFGLTVGVLDVLH
jgi:hypothetical protein